MHRAVPAALLATLLLLSGCSMLGDSPAPSDERAVTVRNETADALADVTAYRMSMDGDVSASGDGQSRSITLEGDGVVNRTTRQMRMNTSAEGQTAAAYLHDRTRYSECSGPWSGWGVENQSTDVDWLTLTPLGHHVALFEQTNVYWDGTARIDGHETAVIVAYPSAETLSSLPGESQTDLANADANIENITAKLWVDKKTSRPVRSLLQIQVSANGGEATANVMIDYGNYDEPITVTAPELSEDDIREIGCPGA